MVAIVAGNGLGLRNTSLNTFNAGGVFEQSAIGQGDDRAIVNVVSGNLILQSQDAQLAGRGTDLFALRTYNSLGTPTDGDQDGWRWGFEQTLRFQGPGAPAQPDPGATVIRTNGDGHEETYTWNAARSAYVGANGGANDELRYDAAAANWIWTNGSTRETELYSNSTAPGMIGRLLRRTDISNNSIALEYDGGRLSLIQDTASQQELRLRYGQFNGLTRLQRLEARSLIDDANGQPTATPGDPLRLVEYDYDNQGRLTTVKRLLTPAAISATNGSGFITNYNYEASTNRIASVTSSDGTSVSFAYDAARRLSAVMDRGGAPRAQLAFSYGPQPNTTEIADGDGQIWTYRHDVATGHLTEVVTPPVGGTSLSTTFSYDANGNLVGMTDPHNNAMTYGYDDVGNRALERDAVGNTMTRTFSPLNQVLTETRYRIADSDGAGPQVPGDPFTTRYVYDANLRLRFVVSAEGRVTENRYASPNASHGLVTETLLYVGQLFDVTGLDPSRQLTETELIDWVAGLPDKTQVQLTEYSYDLRGNVSRQISYATVNANGAGVLNGEASVAEYNYDAYGRLRRSVAVRGSARDQRNVVKSFEYDGIMRVLKSNGADGDVTTNYDDANRRTILVSASGLKETRDFDSRGRLASVSQEGDGTTRQTRNVYDNSDQLRMVEDSQGGQRYRFFDAAGRLAFKVDAIGAVTQFEHNAAGLLVRQTQYLNLANTDGWYDTNTQLVTKTNLTVGGPGSDVIVDPERDRVTTFAYDEAGRLTASSDGENIMTMITYDGLSRVIMTQTGARTTRYLYDKDNRRIGIVDALNYLTEYKYDAGGRLIETVRYSQRSPESVNTPDQLSAWRPAVLDALHSYLYYDGQGRVVGAVDEQQFLTETIFDDALNTRRMLRYLAPVTVAPGDNLASLKSRAGASLQLSLIHYDNFGRVVEATAQDGSTVTRNEYDAAGRLTRVVSAANTSEERIRCTFYNAFGEVTATLGGEGSAWLGTNPSPERIDDAIRDYGIRNEYDTLGRKVRSVDANGNKTVFYYDRENRRTQTVNVVGKNNGSLAGEVSEVRYNSFGEAESVRNYATRIADPDMVQLLANGGGGFADQSLLEKLAPLADANLDQLSLFEYDRCGRVVKEVDAEGGFKQISYNEHGELISEVKSIPGGHTTKQFIYDLKGRLVSRTDDADIINANTRTEYDAFGRVIQTVNAVGLTTTTAYPDHGRRIVMTDPLGRTTSTEYDALGRVSVVTNGLGQQTTYAYDEAARTVTVTTPEGSQTTTTLTRHGETLSVMDGRGNVTRNEFNLDGQITAVMDALGRAIAQTRYDKSGRKVDVGDGRGAFASFRYDQRNRVIDRRFDANVLNLTTQFEFDALGNQISMREWSPIDDERITTYTYDRKGRTKTIILDAVDGGLKLCTTYRYDDLDNVVSIARGTESSPNQQVMLYEFDNLGRRVKEVAAPSSVFGPGAPGTRDLTTQDRYDASGRITRRIDANGQSTWHVYDAAGQQTHSISALGEVSESRYDAAGRFIYSHRYLNRLGADVVASFGDVVTAVPPLVATTNDQRSHLVYDGDSRVRFSLNSTGATGWTISENRCDANGNVIEARAYDRFLPDERVGALDSSGSQGITVAEIQQELFGTLGYRDEDPPTMAGVQRTFFAYDANNRLRFTVDPSGSVVESVWDPAGGLLARVRFAARPALVDHTEVEINAAVNREDQNNPVMHYARDRANRLRYTVDALGAISENEYDGRSNLVRTIGWSIQPVLTEYTENAITAALAILNLTVDREVTNFVYDAADRLRYTIDTTGSITENNYDALGNVVATTRFARRPTPAPATFTEAAISEALEPLSNDAENQITRFVYGAEKRLRFKIDSLGSITESVYDANGNLLATKSFAARPALTQHDEETVAAAVAPLESDPGNRFNRFAYDAVNRLRFSVDSLGSVSERVHNALGNVIRSIRFAVRPTLALHSESAIETAVAPERDHPANRIEHYLHDALGRVRLSVLRVSVQGNLSEYQVINHELNALGQIVSSTSFATAVPLGDITESAIFSALGGADPSRDRVVHFVYDLAGRQIYRAQAVTLENNRLKYRVSAQRFDALGQLVGGTDFATAVFLDGFNKDAIDFAVNAVSDQARDRVSAVVYDAVGQVIFNVGALGPDSHQVTKQDHDPLGRVFRTTQYANAVGALASFDAATVEAAANAVRDANDRKVLYVRDSAGRQRFVIETDSVGRWTVGENQYDALGNIVESRRYDQFVTDARIATIEAIRPTGLSEQDVIGELSELGYVDSEPDALASIQRSRFAYDTQNRLRFTIDALGGVAENVYNTFGELTTTVRFASRPALSQYSENAIDATVARNNAANRVEHFAYDSLGQLRFSVQVIEPNTGSGGSHSLNERRYDSLGQLIESRAYFNPVGHLSAYDEATLTAAIAVDPANDRRSVFAYDAGGRQTFTVRELNVGAKYILTKQIYDALGQTVQRVEYSTPVALAQFNTASIESAVVTDFNDRTTTTVRDAAGRARFEIRPDTSFRETLFDALDRVIEARQFNFTIFVNVQRTEAEMIALRGNRAVGDGGTRGTAHVYDAAGRLISTIDALRNTERYEYNAAGGRTRWVDKNGNVFTCVYDRKGRKASETSPPVKFKLSGEDLSTPAVDRELVTRFEYDAFGNVIRKIEAANFNVAAAITDFLFDTLGRPIGTLYHGFYDTVTGRVERIIGANRFRPEATIDYDVIGNAVRFSTRTGVDSRLHTYRTYNSQGQLVHEINARNNVTRYTYTPFGDTNTVTRHSVTIATTPQNGMFWTAGEIDPQLIIGHDDGGHPIPDFNARPIRMSYDKLGRKTGVTFPTARYYSTHMPGDAGHANYRRPNPNPGTVFGVQDAPTTLYEYNAFGDAIVQRVRANNIVEYYETRFTYDRMGRPIRSVDPAGNFTNMFYDASGNMWQQEELTGDGTPNGTDRTTTFGHNALNQLTSVNRFGLWYTDANGVEHGAAFWSFDNGGEWVDPDANESTTVRTTTYDGYGRALTVTDPAGNVTSMRYDALGHMIELVAPARIIAPLAANDEIGVDPFRNQLSERLISSMTHDAFGRVVRQVQATSQGGDARETRHTYDAAGNLIAIMDARTNTKRRAYDFAGRVIRETQEIRVDLGPLGVNDEDLERRYVYDVLGQLTDTLDVYVDDGNLVQSGKSVSYNAFGEIVLEQRKWGPANQDPAHLNTAKIARHDRDNAGQVSNKVAIDGLTVYFYNLLGQLTREEKRGNADPLDGTVTTRVTETQYDVLGRAIMIRRPAFDADVTVGTGTSTRFVTPYSSRAFDRWGNVTNAQESGFWMVSGSPNEVPNNNSRSYGYDDNNRVIKESLGTHGFVSSSGVSSSGEIYKLTFRDLLGNVVKEVDEVRSSHLPGPISSRTRRKQYNSVGQLTAEIDETNRKVEYTYNIHGERMGTRNARGTVLFDRRDRVGNVRLHGVLRTSNAEYDSFAGTGTIVRTILTEHRHDQASRRFATKTFTDGADAQLAYTWLDGRNFAVKQRDAMGVLTQYRFDPFGNKSLQIDGAGKRTEWTAATTDFVVGRIVNYRLPTDNATVFCDYFYNDFSELLRHEIGDAITTYERTLNGLVQQVIVVPNGTQPHVKELTRFEYDARGKMTLESRFDDDSIQTKMISYDNQGRLWRVEQTKVPNGATCDVTYSYDEWSNVRRVQASYTQEGNDGPWSMNNWYDYDSAGRMTTSNGALVNGSIVLKKQTSGSVDIRYDTVGRRSRTTEYVRQNTNSTPILRTWDTLRDERYEYNDLGHLRQIEQRLHQVNIIESGVGGEGDPQTRPDRIGPWKMMSQRTLNLRGAVTQGTQWTRISGKLHNLLVDEDPALIGTTVTTYRADGQVARTKTDAPDPIKSTETINKYDESIGLLDSYLFSAFRSDGVPFNTTFNYRYTFQNGTRVVRKITDTTNGFDTTKTYDLAGRLTFEEMELPKPDPGGPASDRFEERRYRYGSDGRAIFKKTELRLSSVGSSVPLPDPPTGKQTYVYAGNRIVGTIGSERLLRATSFDFVYTPMTEAGTGGNLRYVVQNGDSLIDIAQINYGDGSLWNAIADANGVTAEPADSLPSSEVGKAYEIPNLVRSRNSASTYTPFSLAEIVGNDRPISIPAPPPPKPSDLEMFAVAAASITIQVGVTVGLTALGMPAPMSVAIGSGLSNLGGQATAWGLDMQAPGQEGIDWGGVGKASLQGYFVSVGGPLAVLGLEVGQQVSTGFAGWTDDSGLSASGIGGSLFNVGFSALSPVLGGPQFGGPGGDTFRFGVGELINSAYNPKSGWAISGSGRSPAVGAFEYAFKSVAQGLAIMSYDWLRQHLAQPSHSLSMRSHNSKFLSDRQGEGSGGNAFATEEYVFYTDQNQRPDDQVIGGITFHPVWHEELQMWDMRDDMGQSLYNIQIDYLARAENQDTSAVAQFWSAVAAVQAQEQAKILSDSAVARLLREQGPRIKELNENIQSIEQQIVRSRRNGVVVGGRTQAITAMQDEIKKLVAAYDPSIERSSPAPIPYAPPYLGPSYSTSIVPLQGPPKPFFPSYAPDIVPDKGGRFGKYGGLVYDHDAVRSSVGDAYAYDIETNMFQVANDLERIARAGYTEIHIATGTHGSPGGALTPEFKFLREDARSILETMQRHPGLKIIPYNMADPVRVAQFNAVQALAADGKLPGGATIDAYCYSRCRVLDPNEKAAGPYGSVELLEGRGSLMSYAPAALNVGFGALSIHGGLQDPNSTIGALKVVGGGAQVLGGASSAVGLLKDSLGWSRFGAGANAFGGYILAPLAFVDFSRQMSHKFDPGASSLSGEEAAFEGVLSTLKLAGALYAPAAFIALGAEYGAKPLAEKGSEYLTPMYVNGISELYGIPGQYVWRMH